MSDVLRVGGFEPLTTIDYPGELACVVFTQGCPWRCRYCHNHELIAANQPTQFDWRQILEFLQRRKGLLDAVVFSGGEPLLQTHLIEAMHQVKALGYKVGLHTGGAYPKRFQQCLSLVDWVGFDVKHLPDCYLQVTQTPDSAAKAWRSLEMLLDSGVAHQLRLTRHPALMSEAQLTQLQHIIQHNYHSELVLQTCNTNHCLDSTLACVGS